MGWGMVVSQPERWDCLFIVLYYLHSEPHPAFNLINARKRERCIHIVKTSKKVKMDQFFIYSKPVMLILTAFPDCL